MPSTEEIFNKVSTIVVVVAIVIREVILLRKCLISLGLFQLDTSLWLFFNGIIFVIIINRFAGAIDSMGFYLFS